jgi:RNA polymerase sigma-70 factor (ECF subfamily)
MAYLNERHAFNDLYNNYSAALFGEILRVTSNDEASACTILKETFLEIYQNMHKHDSDKCRIFTWMLVIARTKATEHMAKVKIRPALSISIGRNNQILNS